MTDSKELNEEELKEKMIYALRGLGASSASVAALLELNGIKGIKGSHIYCPVANYLQNKLGLPLGTSRTHVSVSATRIIIRGMEWVSCSTPPAVSYFIKEFDMGEHSHLREDNG